MSRSPLRRRRTLAAALVLVVSSAVGLFAPSAGAETVTKRPPLEVEKSTGAALITFKDWAVSGMHNGTDSCRDTSFPNGFTLRVKAGESASSRKRFFCKSLQVLVQYKVTGSKAALTNSTVPSVTEVLTTVTTWANAQECTWFQVTYQRPASQLPSGSSYEARRSLTAAPKTSAGPVECRTFKPTVRYIEGAQRV